MFCGLPNGGGSMPLQDDFVPREEAQLMKSGNDVIREEKSLLGGNRIDAKEDPRARMNLPF